MNFQELGDAIGLEEDEYRELIELFITSGMDDLERLRAALAENNFDQAMRAAHTIKGAAGNLGLTAISETAATIEDDAVHARPAGLEAALQILTEQIAGIQKEIDH